MRAWAGALIALIGALFLGLLWAAILGVLGGFILGVLGLAIGALAGMNATEVGQTCFWIGFFLVACIDFLLRIGRVWVHVDDARKKRDIARGMEDW